MRLYLLALLTLLSGAPAWAHDVPPASDRTNTQRVRMTSEQRFEAANVTRDGKLTLEQAKQGYKTIVRHFDAIDATGKGFVTIDDIRAWRKSVRDARLAERATTEDPLRPRHAMQRAPSGPTHEGTAIKPNDGTAIADAADEPRR